MLANQTYASGDQIPQTLKDAVVSIEDRRFYKEKFGIDPVRIASAAFANITGHSSLGLQGGSTLTQQLIKLSVFSTKNSDQTFKRKAQEAWLAVQVERQYSKDQILEYYMNKVYLNNGVYGMQTAAKYYYDKTLKQLSLPQLALIAWYATVPC
ncbi:biosynthetic peptidoglycan transglycosylase [Latilactobacillus sakei]